MKTNRINPFVRRAFWSAGLLAAIIIMFANVISANAAMLLTEDFSYTAGTLLTANGWSAHSGAGTNPQTVVTPSPALTYSTYSGGGGNAVALVSSGEDDNRTITTTSSGSVYMAFLVNASAAQTGGDYFTHFFQTSSLLYGRVYIKKDSSSSNFAFGLSKTSEAAVYTPFNYSLNTTYLVVLKYTFNTGTAADDTVALYVNPVPGNSEPTATIGPITAAGADSTGITAIALRQGSASTAPTEQVDGIRVATTWSEAVASSGGGSTAPSISGISPSGVTNITGSSVSFTVSATGTAPLSYFWFKEIPGTSTNLISSATSAILSFPSAAVADTASYQVIVSNSVSPFTATSSVVSLVITDAPPSIVSITPASFTNAAGSAASFTVTATGALPLSYYWYKEIPGTSTNLIVTATTATLSFPATVLNDTASYQVVVSNAITPYVATSSVVTLVVTSAPPVITSIGPDSITTNAGFNASFTVTNTGTPPFGYSWYKETATTTNLITGATNATLTLTSVLGGDTANYQVVITNLSSAGVTSSVVALTVTGDPTIAVQPANTYGLISNRVQFAVGVLGTSPTYQWHFTDTAGNTLADVANGTQPDGSVISGANSSVLTIDNVQANETYTNFNVTVQTIYGGPIISSNATLLSVGYTNVLAFWDFNGTEFTNTAANPNCLKYPAPYIGYGTATAVGTAFIPPTSPFSGSVDANNGNGFMSYPAYSYPQGYPDHAPPFSWATSTYPTNGNPALNKTAGAQFNVSTVGAKNVKLYYESRFSGTASKYERLQYTTDGSTWIDYPTSSTWPSTTITYYPFNYDFTGFPGVANNPNFGVRIVSEFQNTATYGVIANTNFVGEANNYGTSGTLTYDVVTFSGAAITNNNVAPTLAVSFANTNILDFVPTNISFTVTAGTTPADSLTYSAVCLNTANNFNPTFSFSGTGANRILTINPSSISASFAASPIEIIATDANGDSGVTWFTASVTASNLPPTNSLTLLLQTNTLANQALTIPFSVGDDRTSVGGLSYAVSSGNNTVIPVGNISVTGQGTANPVLNILPGTNQLGVGTVSVTVYDNDPLAAKYTTATIPVVVRPNTNIVAIDYFNYDNSGSLDAVSSGFWQHLTGNVGQMQVAGGIVTVDTKNNTENVQTALLNAPYRTNSSAVLYYSMVVNMQNLGNLPVNNGTYFAMFNDGLGANNTADVEGLLVVATNGAAPGYYRLGIGNKVGATATNSQMVAQDLLPNSNYVVVVSLVLSNGQSTLWLNPGNQSSPSVTDTTALTPTTRYNMTQFELRESGGAGGAVSVSYLKVGTTFDSVFPSLNGQVSGSNYILNWSDPTLAIQSTTNLVTDPFVDVTGATPPYTNSITTTNVLFYRFKP